MVEQIFLSRQVKRSMIVSKNWYIRVAEPVAERLKFLEMQENLRTSKNYCLVLTPHPKMKNLSVLAKIS